MYKVFNVYQGSGMDPSSVSLSDCQFPVSYSAATPRLLRGYSAGYSAATPRLLRGYSAGYSAGTPRLLRGYSAATPRLLRRLVRR